MKEPIKKQSVKRVAKRRPSNTGITRLIRLFESQVQNSVHTKRDDKKNAEAINQILDFAVRLGIMLGMPMEGFFTLMSEKWNENVAKLTAKEKDLQ